jgi:hypothetical protein
LLENIPAIPSTKTAAHAAYAAHLERSETDDARDDRVADLDITKARLILDAVIRSFSVLLHD